MKLKLYHQLIIGVFFLLFALVSTSYALTNKDEARTKVGIPAGGVGSVDVLGWGHKISDSLEAGFDYSYDRMVATITNASYIVPQSPGTSVGNKYWCTYLVIDSFNLAGYSGLTRAHAGVVYMLSFWKSSSDYIFLDYYNSSKQDVLLQVKPGYSILFQDNPGQTTIGDFDHAALVNSITINAHGDGSLVTLDSNLPTVWGKTVNYTINSWEILGTLKGADHPNYSVMGFGTKK